MVIKCRNLRDMGTLAFVKLNGWSDGLKRLDMRKGSGFVGSKQKQGKDNLDMVRLCIHCVGKLITDLHKKFNDLSSMLNLNKNLVIGNFTWQLVTLESKKDKVSRTFDNPRNSSHPADPESCNKVGK